MLKLEQTKKTDKRLLKRMKNHYSKPKGFVGRNICYAIMYGNIYYGHIIGGSSTRFIQGRNEYLGITLKRLNNVVNNVFYNITKVDGKYPTRNFTTLVIKEFVRTIRKDWKKKYGNKVIGFETLIEKPRTGELYKRAGWVLVGETKGYQCKRLSGQSTDSWTGRRVWITDPKLLKPKYVLCLKV